MSNKENIQDVSVDPGASSTTSSSSLSPSILTLNNSRSSLPTSLLDFSSSLTSIRSSGQDKMSEAEFDYKKNQLAGDVKSLMSTEISGSGRFLTRLRDDPPTVSVPVRLHVSNLPFRFR